MNEGMGGRSTRSGPGHQPARFWSVPHGICVRRVLRLLAGAGLVFLILGDCGCSSPPAGSPKSVEALLASPRADERVQGLKMLQPDARGQNSPMLVRSLEDSDPQVRLAAVLAAWKTRDTGAADAVADRLKDADPQVRCSAAYAARCLLVPRAADGVAALLDDPDLSVRMHACHVLIELGDARGGAALEDIAVNRTPPGWGSLLAHVRALDSAAVVRVLVFLSSKGASSNVAATRAGRLLYGRSDETAMKAYLSALNHPDKSVRCHAIWSLGDARNPAAVEPLIQVMREDESPLTREYAAGALGKIGDLRALEPVVLAVEAGRISAYDGAIALGGLGPPAVPHLIAILKNSQTYVSSMQAAEELGRIGDDSALPALIEALNHPEFGVRRESARALKKITGQDFGEDPAKWEQWRGGAKP